MDIILNLLEQYGVPGGLFGLVIVLLQKQKKSCDKELYAAKKKIDSLEVRMQKIDEDRIEDVKTQTKDYIELIKNTNGVLTQLTLCLQSIKDRFR